MRALRLACGFGRPRSAPTNVTAAVLSRPTGYDANVTVATLTACATVCNAAATNAPRTQHP
ncbi:hypothetical protein SUDANB96_06635 [Streptomyces sp. enrichment culture]